MFLTRSLVTLVLSLQLLAKAEQGKHVPLSGPAPVAGGRRVIGGDDAAPGEFPWQAQLKRNGVHICGGVLITYTWAATAAHCLPTPDLGVYQVILGEHDVTVDEGTEQRRGVAQIVFHQDRGMPSSILRHAEHAAGGGSGGGGGGGGDVAMMKLDMPVTRSTAVQPLALPEPGEHFTDMVCETAGWGVSGSTIISPTYPDILQKVRLTVLADDVCEKDLASFNFVPDTMTCAAPPEGKSLCWGDSGGALVCRRPSDGPIMAAITSWAIECSLVQLPSVFVEVPAYVKWINEIIN